MRLTKYDRRELKDFAEILATELKKLKHVHDAYVTGSGAQTGASYYVNFDYRDDLSDDYDEDFCGQDTIRVSDHPGGNGTSELNIHRGCHLSYNSNSNFDWRIDDAEFVIDWVKNFISEKH